ncbi:MAG: secondary thiamine-phosphate synthase enzyme YjbQ [Methanohalobium sp.]|uniref:secondary thiamine-phosphate synthase enzyme YjbQ n=1 Tax=Methanohalobium sp. TaxID=2837493 RepID=UPI00397BD4D8
MYITFSLSTKSRNEIVDITSNVKDALKELNADNGIATIYCRHTTAGITINENADPSVQHDIIETLNRFIPANQSYFKHMEGNADSHIKSSIVGASEQVIIEDGKPVLGRWQGIFFTEFDGGRNRKVHVNFIRD